MQNICRFLAAGKHSAHPIEAVSSVALFFVSVLFFLSLELCKWIRACYGLFLLCIRVWFVVCKQSLWFVGSTCGWLSNGQFLLDLQKELQWTNQGKIWVRAKRGIKVKCTCVFVSMMTYSPTILCRQCFSGCLDTAIDLFSLFFKANYDAYRLNRKFVEFLEYKKHF